MKVRTFDKNNYSSYKQTQDTIFSWSKTDFLMWSICFKCLPINPRNGSFWLTVEDFNQWEERGLSSRNKRVHTMWKSIKKCATKLYKKLSTFLIEATCADGKMWIEYVKSRYKIVIFGLLVFCSWLYVFFSWGVWWLRGPRHNWLFPMRKRHFCILRFCSHSISTPHFFSSSFWMLPPCCHSFVNVAYLRTGLLLFHKHFSPRG